MFKSFTQSHSWRLADVVLQSLHSMRILIQLLIPMNKKRSYLSMLQYGLFVACFLHQGYIRWTFPSLTVH